jgi:hypothetical protein
MRVLLFTPMIGAGDRANALDGASMKAEGIGAVSDGWIGNRLAAVLRLNDSRSSRAPALSASALERFGESASLLIVVWRSGAENFFSGHVENAES